MTCSRGRWSAGRRGRRCRKPSPRRGISSPAGGCGCRKPTASRTWRWPGWAQCLYPYFALW